MVRFDKDRVVIVMQDLYPSERWLSTVRDLLRLMQIADKENIDQQNDCIFGICELISEMLPEEEELRRLVTD